MSSVTAPDDTTVVLTLSKPNAVLPLLPIPIVPEHIWKDIDAKAVKTFQPDPAIPATTVGSGPFRLVEGKTGGSTFRFEANPDYWGGAPHVDQVVFTVYQSKDPAIQALIKGEVDYVNDITPLQVKALQDEPGISAQNGVSPLFEEIAFNTGAIDTETGEPLGDGNPALQDQKFRHALGWAVDNDQIVKTAFQGAAVAGTTIVPSQYTKWHWEPPDDVKFSFDLDKAADELDAAGYTLGSDGKRTMPDGSPIGTLRLFARSDQKNSVDTMDLFQGWLADIGIDSEVTAMDSSALGDRILEGNYDVMQWDWYVEPDPDGILADFTCDQLGGLNDSWYCDEGYDAMYARAARRDRPGQAGRDRAPDAGAALRGGALPRHGGDPDRRGGPQRQVRLLPAAAGPGRGLARPVRRPQLHAAPAGRRGRRLRRRHHRPRRVRGVRQGQLRRCRDDADHRRRRAGRAGHRRRDRAAAAPLDGGRARVTRS